MGGIEELHYKMSPLDVTVFSGKKQTKKTTKIFFFFSNIPKYSTLAVDSGKALDYDGSSSEVARLQGSMLPAGALAVVLVTHYYPVLTVGLEHVQKSVVE